MKFKYVQVGSVYTIIDKNHPHCGRVGTCILKEDNSLTLSVGHFNCTHWKLSSGQIK